MCPTYRIYPYIGSYGRLYLEKESWSLRYRTLNAHTYILFICFNFSTNLHFIPLPTTTSSALCLLLYLHAHRRHNDARLPTIFRI